MKRTHSSSTLQSLPTTKKIQENGQTYFEIYTENGFARSISSPVPINTAETYATPKLNENTNSFIETRILYTINISRNSQVLLGRNIHSGRHIAIKIIDTKNEHNKIQLKNEIRVLSLISHKNIIEYLGHKQYINSAAIYLEYFNGAELFYVLKQNRILPVKVALNIFRQLAETVSYLHSERICHLDIKPENILVNTRQHIKLIDFGLSKRALKNGLVEGYGGSVNYTAPEAVIGGIYNGFLADSWSCGVVLFLMVNGYFPTSGKTPSLPHVPPAVIKITESLLVISPGLRSPIHAVISNKYLN